jgi:hypothetical protein
MTCGSPISLHATHYALLKNKNRNKPALQEKCFKYDSLPEMAQIEIADGNVTFSWKFKYLGSQISYNLHNDNDINARLAAASQSMGALKEVWCNPHLDTYSKYLLF